MPFTAAHTYIAHIGQYPLPRGLDSLCSVCTRSLECKEKAGPSICQLTLAVMDQYYVTELTPDNSNPR